MLHLVGEDHKLPDKDLYHIPPSSFFYCFHQIYKVGRDRILSRIVLLMSFRLPTATTGLRFRIPLTNTARPYNILYCTKCRKPNKKLYKKYYFQTMQQVFTNNCHFSKKWVYFNRHQKRWVTCMYLFCIPNVVLHTVCIYPVNTTFGNLAKLIFWKQLGRFS